MSSGLLNLPRGIVLIAALRASGLSAWPRKKGTLQKSGQFTGGALAVIRDEYMAVSPATGWITLTLILSLAHSTARPLDA